MSEYDPTTNPGDMRKRIWRIQGENANGQEPYMVFHEESVVLTTDGERSLGRTRDLQMRYDPTAIIAMRDPETDAETGETITQAEAYAVLYALGRQAQTDDDARIAAAESDGA